MFGLLLQEVTAVQAVVSEVSTVHLMMGHLVHQHLAAEVDLGQGQVQPQG